MKIIAVDLDEILAETARALLKRKKNRINWKRINWNELSSYNLWEIEKLEISKQKSVVGAKTKLKEFKKRWYKLHVVTARHFLLRFATWIRLYLNYKHIFDSVEFANFFTRFSTKKSEICKKLWADIIIEDNLENAIECANEWIKVYLIDKPWNLAYDKKKHKWIIKVNSWSEIEI